MESPRGHTKLFSFLCFILLLYPLLHLLKSHIRHCKLKCLQQNSGSKVICSLKCGFRRILHKISAAKNLYWLTENKMPLHQITRLKGSIQFSKLKLYNTDHWILSSLFCIQGNHSHMTKACFPETASLERFIIIPFYNNIAAIYFSKLMWTESWELNSAVNAQNFAQFRTPRTWFLLCNKDNVNTLDQKKPFLMTSSIWVFTSKA